MPELGNLNLAVLLGGPATLAGFVWLARMFVLYQRDFTEQYRIRMREQDGRITDLQVDNQALHIQIEAIRTEHRVELDRLGRLHRDCANERHALRIAVRQAGIPWNASDWMFDADNGL